jgi:glycosyltransferase involved in cell wall biosynthesis
VHLADTYDTTAMRALMVARVVASSVVVTEHLPRTDASDPTARAEADGSPTPGSRAAKTAFKRTQYALCDRVICVSQASRRFVLDRYGVAPTKVVTVPNGVGPAPTPAALPDGPARFVAVGSVIVQKGFDLLIDAAELARVPWSIDVVGEGPHRPRLQERADSLGVPVRFVGYRDDVLAVLASATALVVSSRWEASSYVAMEAMQAGRAVVTTRIDALPEIVEDGRTGLLVEPEDPLALAGALDRMASESPLAVRMGRAGYDRVAEFGVDRMIDGVLAQYEGVCHPRHRPAVIGAA